MASMTPSERQREVAFAKFRRDKIERQAEAYLRLKKQAIQLQSMKVQFKIDVVAEKVVRS